MCRQYYFVHLIRNPNIDMHRPGRLKRGYRHTQYGDPLARALERWHSAHTLWTWGCPHTLNVRRANTVRAWSRPYALRCVGRDLLARLERANVHYGRTLRACILTEWLQRETCRWHDSHGDSLSCNAFVMPILFELGISKLCLMAYHQEWAYEYLWVPNNSRTLSWWKLWLFRGRKANKGYG